MNSCLRVCAIDGRGSEKVLRLFSIALGILFLCGPLFGQANFGRILGTVTDPSGGVIAGATVTVLDTQRGLARDLVADGAGEYNAPTLLPGTYTVRGEAKGFKILSRENIVLEVGKEIRVDLTLQPGEQTQTVMVTEALPLVDATSATLGGTLNNADINDLPLNGRNYQNLLSLRPGVVVQPGGGPWTQSTNGVRPDESVWMVDGVFNANFYDARPIAGMPSAFTDGATILPIDAIQEFNLEENPKAEYGWKPGAVVNVGVKSGTNSLHGSAFAFGRDVSWDARNTFNPVPNPILPTQLEQFGGVMGGPIKKDKLFFFGGYEGLRSTVGNAIVTGGIPETIAQATPDPKHSMVDAIHAVQNAGLTPSPVSLALTGCKLGPPVTCSGGLFPSNPTNSTSFTSTFPNTNVTDNGVGKIDYRINSKHMLSGMLLVGNYVGDGEDHPFVNQAFTDTNLIRTWTTDANWIWTPSSTWVNEARFGYDRTSFFFNPNDGNVLADGKGYPINTGVKSPGGLPNINITGFEKLGTWHNRPFHFAPDPFFDFQDNVSYLKGRHAFKFGGEFAHIEVDVASYDNGRGRLDFQSKSLAFANSTPLEDFFAGDPSRGFLLVGNAVRVITWKSSAAFLQDDWRVTPKLILNLGLRYSYVSPMKENNNLFGNFLPSQGLVQEGQPGVDTLWNPDRKNFSPRLGFAWDMSGNGTTVMRGGFGIIYSTFTAATFIQQIGFQNSTSTTLVAVPTGACRTSVAPGAPCPATFGGTNTLSSAAFTASNLNWNGVVFPSGATPSCTAGSQCSIMAVDPNLRTPYVTNWSLGVQHAFTNNFSLDLTYVGNHGSRLLGFRDINQVDPTTGNRPFGAQYPYLKFINQASNDGRSNFNSLQATLTKRISRGLSFIGGYTYGHGLDTGSLNRVGYLPQNSSNPGAEYASSDFDIRHRFTFTGTYNLPGIKGYGQLLDGWQINTIVTLQSSQPWTITDSANDFAGGDSTDRWNFSGNPADFKSGENSIPYCTGPGAGGCSETNGISGVNTPFSASTSNAMWGKCVAKAADPTGTLVDAGCYVVGNSVMTPPANGHYGTMGRNMFRDSGFKDVDFSVFKNFSFKEHYNAQFRAELFNLFNHPIIANPYGSANGWGVGNDPGGETSTFGCGCATPDVAAGNPIVGSGSSRVMQLGFKFTF